MSKRIKVGWAKPCYGGKVHVDDSVMMMIVGESIPFLDDIELLGCYKMDSCSIPHARDTFLYNWMQRVPTGL